ncbi:hypothetical protein M199_gp095 [Halogranum tailed virus 1]|uniref:Uncharacterized protein n=1 Tax=Halogranum tailed virus 1 TaxID=1273749 RepID=R4TH11_9CAUD|nr:hypothetical protein M199_gp095 [Halogranum tailed virus 1]AGM11571.1 hypothetical protein HGTV1_274 [Halogranum tailed virus 1]
MLECRLQRLRQFPSRQLAKWRLRFQLATSRLYPRLHHKPAYSILRGPTIKRFRFTYP